MKIKDIMARLIPSHIILKQRRYRQLNSMRSFNLSKLDFYYENKISFRCADIYNWCIHNVGNTNFDKQYAANELYRHYFANEKKSPNRNLYYYIVQNHDSKYLYHLERDIVLSPSKESRPLFYDQIVTRLNSIDNLEKRIRNHENKAQEDIDFINSVTKIYNRRIRLILHRRLREDKYDKVSTKDKQIIYNILMDRIEDLSTRLTVLDFIEMKDESTN